MRSFHFLLIFIIFTACTNTKHQESKYKSLDEYLNKLGKNKTAMGSVLLFSNGQVEYSKNYGFEEQPKAPIYRIGSISKTYTTVIIAKLVENKLLSYQDKLSKFYPNIPNANKITIEQLILHRSGLKNFTAAKDYYAINEKPTNEKNQVQRIIKAGFEFEPNQKHKYSNTGYILLTYIAQKISGLSYQELLSKYITKPLNLRNTYVYNATDSKPNEVLSYFFEEKWIPASNTHQTVPLGAGAIAATTLDVAKFFKALFSNKLVNKESLDLMKKMVDGYGHALFELPFNKNIGYGHTGGIDGFRSIAAYFPESDLVFVQIVNAANLDTNDISLAMLSSYFEDPKSFPKEKAGIAVEESILKKYNGYFKSKDFPLGIKIFNKGSQLYGQADKQGSYPLLAISNTEFEFSKASIKIIFDSDANSFEFYQGKKLIFNRVK